MNLKLSFILVLFGLFLSSCSRNNALFDVDAYLELTILAGTSTDRVFGFEKQVVFPFETQLAAFDDAEKNIDNVRASYCLVYPKFQADIDLSFINEITIDALNPDDLEDDREVFYYEQFDFGRKSDLELFPSLPDIHDFIRDEKLILRVEFIFNSPPPTTFDLAFEMMFGALESE